MLFFLHLLGRLFGSKYWLSANHMADSRKRRIHSGTEEDKSKSAKTCDNEDVDDDGKI